MANQQRALLEEVSYSEAENYDFESDAEPEDKDPSDIPQEPGNWTYEHISKPRNQTKEALQVDPLYTGDMS
jgi:hypothetical protein